MDKITTTIKRQFLAEIVAGTKKIEYREIKPYWTKKFDLVSRPFILRLINGMSKRSPEVTVQIKRITVGDAYELRIGKILEVKNWPLKSRPSRK
jgi:hypothetical protein